MNSKELAINHIEYNLSQNNLNCLFVALSDTGKKMFSLYSSYKELVFGKTEDGYPIPKYKYCVIHLVHLSTNYEEANKKDTKLCKSIFRANKLLQIADKPTIQNPYEYKTVEQIAEEKDEKIQWEKQKLFSKEKRFYEKLGQNCDLQAKNKLRSCWELHYSFRKNCGQTRIKLRNGTISYPRNDAKSISTVRKNYRTKEIQLAKISKHKGEVGENISTTLFVQKIFSFNGYWGESYIFNLVDFEGNVFVYKGSKYLHHENEGAKEGDRIEVRGKIKEHSIYKSKFGVSTKQTRLERIKVYNLIKGE